MRISYLCSDVCSSSLRVFPQCRNSALTFPALISALRKVSFTQNGRHDLECWSRQSTPPELRSSRMRGVSPILSQQKGRRHAACRFGRNASSERKSVVWGKSESVRVDLGGRRLIK